VATRPFSRERNRTGDQTRTRAFHAKSHKHTRSAQTPRTRSSVPVCSLKATGDYALENWKAEDHRLAGCYMLTCREHPLKYIDPSGYLTQSAACGPDGILCPPHRLGPNGGPLILPYPSIDPEEIPDIGHKDSVIQQYELIRKWLYKNYGYKYIDQ
jgi:hypothetical protein